MHNSRSIEYPFAEDNILLKDAIEYLGRVIYPKESKREREHKVRSRITGAIKAGKFGVSKHDTGDRVSALDLFTWAARSRSWSALYQIPDLPVRPESGEMSASVSPFSASGSGTVLPVNRRELEQAYQDLHTEYQSLRREYERVARLNEELTIEVEYFRSKRATESAKKSSAAKKPRS